jgi:hypothetical protein
MGGVRNCNILIDLVDQNAKRQIPVVLIVGVCLGSLAVIGISIGAFLYRRRHLGHHRHSDSAHPSSSSPNHSNDNNMTGTAQSSSLDSITKPNTPPPPAAPRSVDTRASTPERTPIRTDTGEPFVVSPLKPRPISKSPPKTGMPHLKVVASNQHHMGESSSNIGTNEIISPVSPVGPSVLPLQVSSRQQCQRPPRPQGIYYYPRASIPTLSHPSRSSQPIFPYGYQSEYPELAVPEAAATARTSKRNQKTEIDLLQREEQLIRERVMATEQLLRLKNEEMRVLERQRRILLGSSG